MRFITTLITAAILATACAAVATTSVPTRSLLNSTQSREMPIFSSMSSAKLSMLQITCSKKSLVANQVAQIAHLRQDGFEDAAMAGIVFSIEIEGNI
jgi:hypothetical protein